MKKNKYMSINVLLGIMNIPPVSRNKARDFLIGLAKKDDKRVRGCLYKAPGSWSISDTYKGGGG